VRPGLSVCNQALNVPGAGQHGSRLAGQELGLTPGHCRRADQGVKGALTFGICVLKMLAEGLQSARLGTRTKECIMYASWWVESP